MANQTTSVTPKKVSTAVMIISPLAFLVSMPWLKEQTDTVVYTAGMIAATLTVVSSMVLAVLKDNDLDEWQRGSARFGSQWGWLTGAGIVAIAQGLPFFQDGVMAIVSMLTKGDVISETGIKMAFMAGFMAVVLAQMVCTLALRQAWRVWMSREA